MCIHDELKTNYLRFEDKVYKMIKDLFAQHMLKQSLNK